MRLVCRLCLKWRRGRSYQPPAAYPPAAVAQIAVPPAAEPFQEGQAPIQDATVSTSGQPDPHPIPVLPPTAEENLLLLPASAAASALQTVAPTDGSQLQQRSTPMTTFGKMAKED